ncbi:rhomboid family intramembrane serine protease [Clostridium sp. FP2]|uniref:rhomboid family intramembrane serine protease n=1 Tax=Clostridium TaxID=1485 RepID=UPI0013E94F05|nr:MULTISPECIES: rhomboid family intramembrane serine protease [Clostridium]MBW9159096.1 rhomboid family intramembrane serine protease [Clostridium tagluense]MBZ9625133.1 rhomboid family intramembrane serine protease [Clostridium sp. FP2]WLC64927.1 rhomboid family intramembrane serine protease [Clostridium tagluense]
MNEKTIKIVIKGITQQYGYLLEDIRSRDDKSDLWTVSKDINGDSYRLIFISSQSLDGLKQYDIPEDKNNIYILFSEDEFSMESDTKALSINNLLEKPLIRVEIKDKKVNYCENVNLQVVQELASVMSNNNLQSNSEKISLADKPWVTIGIIAINVIMYLVTAYLSYVYAKGSMFNSDINVLVLLGAKVNELIAKGQYYRFISCMFLHGGIVHLGVNMYSLYSIGPMVEKVYGKAKYIAIYFASGICASIFSYIFSTSVSIGASGAIFGLLGAVLVFAIKAKGKTGKGFIRSILSVIFINIFIGVTLPNIDNFAHIGGLIGGMLIAFLVSFKTEE